MSECICCVKAKEATTPEPPCPCCGHQEDEYLREPTFFLVTRDEHLIHAGSVCPKHFGMLHIDEDYYKAKRIKDESENAKLMALIPEEYFGESMDWFVGGIK